MRRTVDRPWLCWQRRVEQRCSRWGAGRGMSGPGAPGAPRSPAAPAPRRPWLSAAPAAPPHRSGQADLSQPRTLISARRLARRQPLPGRQGHHWGCTGGKKQLRTRETAHAPRYSATQDRPKKRNSGFYHFRPIVTSQVLQSFSQCLDQNRSFNEYDSFRFRSWVVSWSSTWPEATRESFLDWWSWNCPPPVLGRAVVEKSVQHSARFCGCQAW